MRQFTVISTEVKKQQTMANSTCTMIGIIGCFIAFAITCVFNALSSQEIGRDWGIFKSSTGNVSDKYNTDITPAGWTFTIWGVIYFWQTAWLIYAQTTLCRKGFGNDPLYVTPGIISPFFCIIWILNMAANTSWIIIWDREYLTAAAVVLIAITLSLYIMLFMIYRSLNMNIPDMVANKLSSDIALVRALLINGLAVYATWVTCASFINVLMVLQYEVEMDGEEAATICLSILFGLFVVYCLLDITVLDRFTRYTFTPYFVLIMASLGIISAKWADPIPQNVYITLGLLAAAGLLLLVKIVVVIWRACRDKGSQTV